MKSKGKLKSSKWNQWNINLVQLVDTVGNVNNEVSIIEKLTFDSNYKKSLQLAT